MAEWQLRDERTELQKRKELDHSSSTERKKRANRAKAESRERESREQSKMVDNIIREVITSCTIDPFRELDKSAASLTREVDNTNDFFPIDFM